MERSFQEQRRKIVEDNRGMWNGVSVALKLTEVTDAVISRTFESFLRQRRAPIAVFAPGGYGRCELNLNSDVDLLIIVDDSDKALLKALEKAIRALWDLGLEVGHQVLTPDQAVTLALNEWTFRTTLLEMRFLWGDESLASTVERVLNDRVIFNDYKTFLKTVLDETAARHKKFGNSPQLLEPDVKNGMGGLRDFHALLWLYRSHPDFSGTFKIRKQVRSATMNLLQHLFEQSFLLANDFTALRKAFEFLLSVRNELHLLTDQKMDRLEYGLQKDLASRLTTRGTEERLAVEKFLRDYYLHVRKIYHSYQILSELFIPSRSHFQMEKEWSSREVLAPGILKFKDAIVFEGTTPRIFSERPELLMQVFRWQQEYNLKLGEFLRNALYLQSQTLSDKFQNHPAVVEVFLKIMQNPKNLGRVLRVMHELEILDRFLPEFSAITALAQHDLYHYYSADEHTILAIENVADLLKISEDPFELKATLQSISEKEVLFLALLFHDIGKALPGPHTENGVALASRVFRRWNLSGERVERVLFLIRNHLKMEQFAFRRNSEDPSTLQKFAKIVGDVTNLKLLYLLTYGDLSALNPTVWSEWKAIQLWELFRRTRRYLSGECISEALDEKELSDLAEEILGILPAPFKREEILNHLRMMGEEYLKSFGAEEISGHLLAISQIPANPAFIEFKNLRTHWGVTVVTRDRPSLLAEICGVLAANDLSIFAAQIFTREDGFVIDSFRVLPFSKHIQFSEIVQKDILNDLVNVLSGKIELGELLARHKRRWKRHPLKKSGKPVEIVFDNQLSRDFTIIDIFTDDALGLLYQIARTLSSSGVNIQSAKISTRVDQVSDSFYVTDENGQKIVDSEKIDEIRKNILRSLK
ncbi:MAG: [protein-PII] uridylyltransferase [Calditrichaeota bacterium]|nr:[protein-PII] uridylyltransferase [Calditrichota bacterium]